MRVGELTQEVGQSPGPRTSATDGSELHQRAVRQPRGGTQHVVNHVAVDMEREPQELLPAMPPRVAWALVETSTGYHKPCCFSSAFQVIQDHARLHRGRAVDHINFQQFAEIFAVIDDQAGADGLAH